MSIFLPSVNYNSTVSDMRKILKQCPGVLENGDYTSSSHISVQARLLLAISFLGL